MTDIEITIKLPEALVKRVEASGLSIEQRTAIIIEALEADLRREAAAQRLAEIAEALRTLPADLKPTPEEIAAEIRAARTESS